jgi:hypothetical protein
MAQGPEIFAGSPLLKIIGGSDAVASKLHQMEPESQMPGVTGHQEKTQVRSRDLELTSRMLFHSPGGLALGIMKHSLRLYIPAWQLPKDNTSPSSSPAPESTHVTCLPLHVVANNTRDCAWKVGNTSVMALTPAFLDMCLFLSVPSLPSSSPVSSSLPPMIPLSSASLSSSPSLFVPPCLSLSNLIPDKVIPRCLPYSSPSSPFLASHVCPSGCLSLSLWHPRPVCLCGPC